MYIEVVEGARIQPFLIKDSLTVLKWVKFEISKNGVHEFRGFTVCVDIVSVEENVGCRILNKDALFKELHSLSSDLRRYNQNRA